MREIRPDLILTQTANGQAVAVSAGRIVAVGSDDDIRALARPETQVVTLNGAALLPGFNDAHCHVLGFGLTLDMVALSAAHSIPALLQLLPPGSPDTWIRGRGCNQNALAERRHPTRQDLDTLPGNPYVLLIHASGHAVAVNSRVLALADITRETPDPPGGTIVRDRLGEPTGVLLETAVELAYRVLPEATPAEKIAALGRASSALHKMGITSATDATMGASKGSNSIEDIAVYQDAANGGELTLRCTLMMQMTQLWQGDRYLTPNDLPIASDFLRLGPAKLFTDGALTTRTAFLRSPYADSADQFGTAIWDAETLNAMIAGAHGAGWQIAAHAIGDAAIDLCLDAYDKAQQQNPRLDSRHRVEHAMLLWPDQIARMAALGILPVYQPEFLLRFGDAYTSALGQSRASRLMPYPETVAAGLPLVFSSDLPVVPGAPLDGIAAAVTRPTFGVTVPDALRAYTSGAAYSAFNENDRGQIAPGHRADFVVLSHDPTQLPIDEWADDLQIQATLVGGKVVYGEI